MKIAGWYGTLAVQNTDGSQDANVTINYRTRGSSSVVYSETVVIKPLASHYSDMLDSAYEVINTLSGVTNWVGTVEIMSNNGIPVAAREIQSNINNNLRGVHEAFLDSDKGEKFYIPLVQGRNKNKGGNGWTGYLLVQNLSNDPITITVDFIKGGSSSGTTSVTDLQPYDSFEFNPDMVPAIASDPNWVGSAIVTSDDSSELFIAEHTNVNNKPPKNNYYLYKGNKDGSTSQTLYFPYQHGTSSLVNYNVVQNVGGGLTDVTYTYYDLSGAQVAQVTTNNVAAGTGFERATHIDEGFSTFIGSLMITSDSEPIEGYSTMCDLTKTSSGFDSCGTYTGTK
jgi:hypothetical protein